MKDVSWSVQFYQGMHIGAIIHTTLIGILTLVFQRVLSTGHFAARGLWAPPFNIVTQNVTF